MFGGINSIKNISGHRFWFLMNYSPSVMLQSCAALIVTLTVIVTMNMTVTVTVTVIVTMNMTVTVTVTVIVTMHVTVKGVASH